MEDVMLAVPTRGTVTWQTVTRLNEVHDRHPGLQAAVYQPGNLSVALTRNKIVKRFLATSAQVLVMVDDDVVPPVNFIEVLRPLVSGGGYALAAVPHVMPSPNGHSLALTAWNLTSMGLRLADLNEGINEVHAVATGCCAISREALELLGPNPFRMSNDPDRPTSDDFLLCQDLRNKEQRIASVCGFSHGWYCDHVTAVNLAPLLAKRS
jgi:hypothetical protein